MSDRPVTPSRLREFSDLSLENLELSRRSSAANLTRELRTLLYQIVDDLVEAELARVVREHRREFDSEPITEKTIAGELGKITRPSQKP